MKRLNRFCLRLVFTSVVGGTQLVLGVDPPGALPSPVVAWQAVNVLGERSTDSHPVTVRGYTRLLGPDIVALDGGALLLDRAAGDLLTACRRSNQLTIEVVLRTDWPQQTGPARIITFSRDHSQRNFTLGQDGDQLVFRLRTPKTGLNGVNPQVTLCPAPLEAAVHIAVTYADGLITCYKNGTAVLRSRRVSGDFSNWESSHLLLGDEWNGERNWRGVLTAAAVYDRALTPAGVSAMFEAYSDRIHNLTETKRHNGGRIALMQPSTQSVDPAYSDMPPSAENRIRPCDSHPFYWQYRGRPLLLLGGSKDDNLFQIPDLQFHLDQMASIGANYIRNTMSDRPDGGYEVYPFRRLASGAYDLEQWNDEYWTRFARLLELTWERAIIVQIEVWDRFDYSRANWLTHPYNPKNNINYSHDESALAPTYPSHPGRNLQPFFFTTPNQQNNEPVLRFQQRFVDKMLSYSLHYDHVLYCMDNETSAAEAWATYWAEYIRSRASEAGRAICLTEMWDDTNLKAARHRRTLDHPERYAFADVSQNNHNKGQEHWDNFQWVRRHVSAQPRPLNTVKTYGADNGPYGTSRDGVERWWRHLIGGAAAARFHRPDAGLGLGPPVVAAIQSARKLESLISLWDIEPANELLNERAENEAYLAARPGKAYALYFTDGGSVRLDLSAADMDLDLHWIEIGTGSWGPVDLVKGGGMTGIRAPGDGPWVAALLSKAGDR